MDGFTPHYPGPHDWLARRMQRVLFSTGHNESLCQPNVSHSPHVRFFPAGQQQPEQYLSLIGQLLSNTIATPTDTKVSDSFCFARTPCFVYVHSSCVMAFVKLVIWPNSKCLIPRLRFLPTT